VAQQPDLDQLEELLASLRQSVASLAPYSLTLYRRVPSQDGGSATFVRCCGQVKDTVSNDVARHYFASNLEAYFEEATPSVCLFGGAFFAFVIPFTRGSDEFCLVGDGVRDTSIDLWQLAALSRKGGADVFSLFPHVESLPTASAREVETTARETARDVNRLTIASQYRSEAVAVAAEQCHEVRHEAQRREQERADTRLARIARFLEQVDRSKTLIETIALGGDAILSLVDPPKLLMALPDDSGSGFLLSGLWGLPDDLGYLPPSALDLFVGAGRAKQTLPISHEIHTALPGLDAAIATCFPLESRGERLGFVGLLDCHPSEPDAMAVSMLVHGMASKLSQLIKEAEQARTSSLSGRLLSLTNTLLHVASKDELYKTILEIAADLLNAGQGSIMLIDKNNENMHIVFTKGITLHVAQCLPLKVGKGIAGRVAQSGQPLLVNDVEKDSRVAMINRPRFKSKALICIPLKLKERIIGVLNLSDKADLAPFTEADLQLLTSFANLASLMIERTLVLEESVRFEQLSVTDSLTGLYNRRFLKSRIEEELNRSNHQGLNLSILFIDLDFFKNYNDVCGHLAGDEALKRTADIIQASLREMDTVARYGGEEFCALLPGTSREEALIVAERIRAEIEAEKFPGQHNLPHGKLTASFGVACFPEDGRTYTALVHASDIALYQAKANGRNRVVSAHTSPAENAAPSPPAATPAAAARTFDFNSYLEATEALRQRG
jgi:diguanylate cyclase (GGDEF)-like protein